VPKHPLSYKPNNPPQYAKLFGCVNAYFSDEMIMTNYKWLLFLSILLSNSVLAEDREHHQEPVINVTGHAELIVPADAASLIIGARITAKTAKEAEAKVRLYPYHLQKPSCLRHPVIF
jgi:hypothetical protein